RGSSAGGGGDAASAGIGSGGAGTAADGATAGGGGRCGVGCVVASEATGGLARSGVEAFGCFVGREAGRAVAFFAFLITLKVDPD
ncbi:MAG: hypothetical protein AAFV29_22040, partial [Myxococcota bacterium]